ncbi:hypothetical protein BGZ94_007475 [Podila epigama]|nr:hypothetical protein BGZ94_007475 [Podila epigama]
MSGTSKASKEQQGVTSSPYDANQSSPASSKVTADGTVKSKDSKKSKAKETTTTKTKKPSLFSRLFCCSADYIHDNDASQQAGGPTIAHVTSSNNKSPHNKVALASHTTRTEEKDLPSSEPPVDESVSTAVVEEDDTGTDKGEGSDQEECIEVQLQTPGDVVPGFLAPISPEHVGRKCLVLDLDETLVHSSFKVIPQADYVVPVDIDNQTHNVYVIKRPGVDTFLKKMGEIYEVVVFTASLSKYADPVLDMLDVHHVVKHRLFRESCLNHKGNYVKDLSVIGRDLKSTIIIDNSPASYIFHQSNAVPISSWFNDPHDTELLDLIPFLVDLIVVDDVNPVLDMNNDEQ